MKEQAFLFPGQGSQVVGMGKDLFEKSDLAKKVFRTADEVLGLPLSRICFEGPEEELKLTYHTQPALLTVSYILFQLLGQDPGLAAGHSLGEYSAFLCAGTLTFAEAVLLVYKRGRYMQEAVPLGKGAMAALIGVTIDQIKAGIAQVQGQVDLANYNSRTQVVISGEKTAVEAAVSRIAAAKSVFLPVSAPFHSGMMLPAEEKLAVDLQLVNFRAPRFPVLNNVDVREVLSGEDARDGLRRQVSRPVLWNAIMEKMLQEKGVRCFTEIGTGRVLSGLIKRTAKDLNLDISVRNIEKWVDLGI